MGKVRRFMLALLRACTLLPSPLSHFVFFFSLSVLCSLAGFPPPPPPSRQVSLTPHTQRGERGGGVEAFDRGAVCWGILGKKPGVRHARGVLVVNGQMLPLLLLMGGSNSLQRQALWHPFKKKKTLHLLLLSAFSSSPSCSYLQ